MARRLDMNRRELLASFLGLPWLAAGCDLSEPRLPPNGDIVGASVAVGHRLRSRPPSGGSSTLPVQAQDVVDVLIVGGGIAGLTAARRLKQQGVSFVLLELESSTGGTAAQGTSSVISYPWGAHYLPVPMAHHVELIDLLDDMQLLEGRTDDGSPIVAEQFLCRAPQERLFIDGQWHDGLIPEHGASSDDLRQFAAFQREIDHWVAWRDDNGNRAFTLPVAACSRDAAVMRLDQQTMTQWMVARGLTSPRLRWYVDYCCRDDYGLTVDQTSAWAGIFYFAARVTEPGMDSQSFITWPEGNGYLADWLYRQVAEQVQCDQLVTTIRPAKSLAGGTAREESTTGQVVEVVSESASDPSGPMRVWQARHVIFCAPPFLAPVLIDGYREHLSQHSVSEVPMGSWLVANLHLSNRPVESGFPLSWDNVLYHSPSLGYVAATHQRGIDHGPTVFTYYYPLCDDDPRIARERLLSLPWRDWADVILSDLERAHPDIRSLTHRLDIMRWGHAMVRPTPGLINGSDLVMRQRPFMGIHFAHSALSGIPLFEEAFYHGNRAANEVVAELKSRL